MIIKPKRSIIILLRFNKFLGVFFSVKDFLKSLITLLKLIELEVAELAEDIES
jgi:hypothetical protein